MEEIENEKVELKEKLKVKEQEIEMRIKKPNSKEKKFADKETNTENQKILSVKCNPQFDCFFQKSFIVPKNIFESVFISEDITLNLNKGILLFQEHLQEYNENNKPLFENLLKKIRTVITDLFQNADVILFKIYNYYLNFIG